MFSFFLGDFMATQKVYDERNHTIHPVAKFEAKKLQELKSRLKQSHKDLEISEDVLAFLSYVCEKIAEGKTLTVIDQTELWSVAQAAKELGVTRPTVYKMAERGDLQAVDCEGVKIVPSSVITFLRKQEDVKQKALFELSKIDSELKPETRNITFTNREDNFEDVDLE